MDMENWEIRDGWKAISTLICMSRQMFGILPYVKPAPATQK